MEGPDRLRVSWSLPPVPGPLVGDGFLLRLWDGARGQERRENVSSPQARTALLTGLTPGTYYQLDVRLYHCTLLGPASPAARVLLPPSGTLGRGWRARDEGGQSMQGTHGARKDMGGYRSLDGQAETTGRGNGRREDLDVRQTGAQGGQDTGGSRMPGPPGVTRTEASPGRSREGVGREEDMGPGGHGDTVRKTWDVRGSRSSLVKEATARGIYSPGRNRSRQRISHFGVGRAAGTARADLSDPTVT